MRLCDVTLGAATRLPERDYTADQRVEAGRALDRLGLPLVQAGTPAAGEVDSETVQRLADDLAADVIACASLETDDVDRALDAGADIIEVSTPISDVQLEHTLGISREEAFDRTEVALGRARDGGADVHLTLNDAFRADVPTIAGVFGRFDCPIVLADTVGVRTPPFVAGFLRTLADASADLTRAGVHFQDDLGCATANAIIAAETGIDRVNVSVAGLGDRAGISATEEVIAATEMGGGDAGIVTEETIPVCEDVLRTLGESVDEHKALLGERATTHESAAHTDAVLEAPSTFEPFDPARFGGRRQLRFNERTTHETARRLLERADRSPNDAAVDTLLEQISERGPIGLDEALTLASDV